MRDQMKLWRYTLLLLWILFPFASFASAAFDAKERHLALGDFADFNRILDGAVLRLSDAKFDNDGATLRLSNVRCWELAIGDANLWSRQTSLTSIEVNMQVTNLDMFCRANYQFSAWWLFGSGGSGIVDIQSIGNDASLKGKITSPNFLQVPPNDIVVQTCDPTVYINSVNFSNGGVFGSILNIFRGILANFMEDQARGAICEQLRTAMEDTESVLQYVKEALDKYKPNGTPWNPLEYENSIIDFILWLTQKDATNLLNFRDPNTDFAGWLESSLNQVVNYLSSTAQDPNTGATDMKANILLRDTVLENGALNIDSSIFANGDSSVVYEGHNEITKTSVRFNSVRMVGLDSLKTFNPLDNIGNFTLQNQLSWDQLGFQIQATIEMRPSTLSDSIIETPGNTRIIEQVEIFFGLDDLDAELSLLTLFDQDRIKTMSLGSLLEKDNITPCLLSTIVLADIASLSVDVSDILTPTLNGFVSPGIDRIFSSSMNAGFLMYEKLILKAAPRYFQEKLRPVFAQKLLTDYLGIDNFHECPASEWSGSSSDLVDFRDLLLPPSDALVAGATGEEPYGNLFSSFVVPYLQENVFQGELFNDGYVRPITKAQSGTEGTFVFEEALFQYNATEPSLLYDSLTLSVSNLRLQNVDTVVGPMKVLDSTDWNILSNTIAFDGSSQATIFGDRDLTMLLRIDLGIDGVDTPLQMKNTIDVSLSIPSSALTFEMIAVLNEASVINFPVFDLMNYHCWLATLDSATAKSLALLSMSLEIDTLRFNSSCVSCSSPGMESISEIVEKLEAIGFNTLYKDKIVAMLVGLIADYTYNFDIKALVDAAPKYCPHHPLYDPTAEGAEFSLPGLPALRSDSVEIVIAIGTIVSQCAMVVAAKNQLLLTEDALEQPSNETIQVEISEGSRIVNWTSLADDLGDGVGVAFEELRFYLKDTVKETAKIVSMTESDISRSGSFGIDLKVNEMLREYVLDSDGTYSISFEDMTFVVMNFEFTLVQVDVYGLDSIKAIDPLVPAGPQLLENRIEFEDLLITLQVDIRTIEGAVKPMTISYELEDITVQMDLAIALDIARLEGIQLGSIFDMTRIFFCAIGGIQDLKFTKLSLSVNKIGDPVINGYFSDENKLKMDDILQSLFNTYRSDLLVAMPLLFDSSFKEILNAMLPQILELTSQKCLPPSDFFESGVIDFRDLFLSESMSRSFGGSGKSPYSNLFRTLYDMMQEIILQSGASNRPLINDLLRGFTERYSNMTGSMSFQGESLENSGRIKIAGLDAIFGVAVSDVSIENVDSVGDPLNVFRPLFGEAHTLNNTISFGVDSKPLGITGNLLLSLNDDVDMQIRNEMSFAVSFENVVLVASILLKIGEKSFASFPLRDLSNMNCWLATVLSRAEGKRSRLRGIDLVDHSFSVGNFSMGINCVSCSSPRFDELLVSLYDFSNTTESIESIEEKTDNLLDADFIQVLLDHVVEDSAKKCPHRPEFDPNIIKQDLLLTPEESLGLFKDIESIEKSIFLTVANSMIAGCIFIFGLLCRRMVDQRNKQWMESLSREGRFHLQIQQNKETEMVEILNATSTSILRSACIPMRVRYGVPFALALNLGLYLGAHLRVLSVVDIEASLAGEEFTIYSFLEFTFLESTKKTFENGGAEMIILLWIFTGIWPYIKIFLSLAMWIVPPKRLSITTRGRILLWIDAAAKLSVIDIFTVIVGVALLLVFIGGPDESYVSEDALYTLKAVVVPRVGFYCIIVAQRMSRLSSRFFLEYHEQVLQHTARAYKSKVICDSNIGAINSPSKKDALHAPEPPSDGIDTEQRRMAYREYQGKAPEAPLYEDDREASSIPSIDNALQEEIEMPPKEARWGLIGVYFGSFTIVIVFIIGAIFAPSISLDASSVAALAIESDKTYAEIVQNYGVFLVVCGVLLKARFVFEDTANYIGFGLLLFTGVVSIGGVFIMRLYRFTKRKMKERQSPPPVQTFGHKGCGIPFFVNLTKWRHMEIYLISVAIGIWQLGSISSYVIYLYCEILHRTFACMSFIGLVEDTSAECYSIQALLPENLCIILGSFAILVLSFILQASGQYKKNIAESLRWIDDDDMPHLSLAWSQDKSKNIKYSHLSPPLTGSSSWETAATEYTGSALETPATFTSPCSSFEDLLEEKESASSDEIPSTPGRIGKLSPLRMKLFRR